MAWNVLRILLLCCLLSASRADRISFSKDDEKRWNTPPELIPEQIVESSKQERVRLLSAPTEENKNPHPNSAAHSMSVHFTPEGLSVSGSRSFSHTLSRASGSTVSGSRSLSLTAGLDGVAVSRSHATALNSDSGSRGNVGSKSFNLGNAKAETHAAAGNGMVMSGAGSSMSFTKTSASTSAGTKPTPQPMKPSVSCNSQEAAVFAASSIHPYYLNYGYRESRRPTLSVEATPYREHKRAPIRLVISPQRTQQPRRKPTVHIRKWQPTSRSSSSTQEVPKEIIYPQGSGPIELQVSSV